MEWVVAVLVIVVLGVAAVVSSGGLGAMSGDPVRDVYRQDLPDRPLRGDDIATLRFGTALRGYAMGEVDDVLERLGHEIAERDAYIAELDAQLTERDDRIAELGGRTGPRTGPRTGARQPAARSTEVTPAGPSEQPA